MLRDKNRDLINEFRGYVESNEARTAYDILIDAGRIHNGLSCHPQLKGVVRDFRYYSDEKTQPFAFIVNQQSLLFYLRLPAVRSKKYSVPDLQRIFEYVSENAREEITLKIFNGEQARLVVTEVLNKWWD